jgi:hypothetical protein
MPRAKSAETTARVGPRLVAKSVLKAAKDGAIPHEHIATRAYELFLQEGGGDDVGQWLRAEQELLEVQVPVRAPRKVAGARAKA